MTYYRIRQRLREICYVERDVLVEADSPEEARQKAIDDDTLDTGEDHCQELEECTDYGIAADLFEKESEPEVDEEWGKRWEETTTLLLHALTSPGAPSSV
jgi:hypothetical protein